MRSLKKTNFRNGFFIGLLIFSALLISASALSRDKAEEIMASQAVAADFRIIFTTDLHGRVIPYDYQSGKKYNEGSLAKAYTLIKKARSESGAANTMTFDLGDCLSDYTTEYIYQEDSNAVQPIYKAMKKVDYDAITVGNHDLSYGLSYIKKQYKNSGLSGKVILSNVKYATNNKTVWGGSKIIKKRIKAENGKYVTINVGVIGVVVPKLSSKTDDYTGVLISDDIVELVEKDSENLKSKGADIVVVLSHSGMGDETPEQYAKNASYALTKLENVDVVLCGHEHKEFPSEDGSSQSFYSLPGVNKKTGLVNNKVLIMSKDMGRSIGVADLKLSVSEKNGVKIKKAVPSLRHVKSSTAAAKEITDSKIMGKWDKLLRELAKNDKVIANVAEGELLNNYFGIIKDCNAIQVFNNAKIAFGLYYIYNNKPEYLDKYPIIAASRAISFGEIDGDDYISFNDEIRLSDISDFMGYNRHIGIYKITGAQLREWLEWSASAYESPTKENFSSSDSVLNTLIKSNNLKSPVKSEYVNNWTGCYFFDGIEYTIDPNPEPRYDVSGQKINDTNRIISITRNGITVNDTDEFILVADSVTLEKEAQKGISRNYISGFQVKAKKVQDVLKDYLISCSDIEDLSLQPDNNWRVFYSPDYRYVIKSGARSNTEAVKNNWTRLASNTSYAYYEADLGNQIEYSKTDETGPLLVVSPGIEEDTNQSVKILVQASDISGLRKVVYLRGDYNASQGAWNNQSCKDASHGFEVTENGIYSVCAEDIWGNRTVSKVRISVINSKILQKPVVNRYTNRSKKLTGNTEPGGTVMIQAGSGTFQVEADEKGKFEAEIPYQKADSKVKVWVLDRAGRKSAKNSIVVKRKGPNYPELDNITNSDEIIYGNLKDKNVDVVVIVGGKKVYLANDNVKRLWQKTSIYKKNIKVVKTDIKVKENGDFSVKVPIINGNTAVKLYTVDAIGRISRLVKTSVEVEGPNQPKVYAVTNAENVVYGKVPKCSDYKDAQYEIRVEAGNEEYKGVSDSEGRFAVNIKKSPGVGKEISVYAVVKDEKEGNLFSAVRDVNVVSADRYIKKTNSRLYLDDISNKKTHLTGNYKDARTGILISVGGNKYYNVVTDNNGNISIDLEDRPKANSVIYAVSRYETGEIEEVSKINVRKGKPEKPEFLDDVDNTVTCIHAATDEKCKMIVITGGKTYYSVNGKRNDITGDYRYSINVKRLKAGDRVEILAQNSVGYSEKRVVTVREAAPDTPYIEKITEDTKVIKGRVHIIAEPGYDKTPTVKYTGTKVWIKIGDKKKSAVVNDDGSFELKVKGNFKLKAGDIVTYWGENDYGGEGPKGNIKISE